MRRHNAPERWTVPCAAAYAALCRSGVHDLQVVTRSYSLSQLSLLKAHETLVPSVGRFQSADRIIGHNHPSGDILPSSQDRAVTRSLANAGKVLGVPLHDHLIIGMNGKRFSFAESLPEDLRAT